MKQLTFLLTTAFFLILSSGCNKSDFRYQTDYQKSLKAWHTFKQQSGNSYQYIVGGGSWVGSGWETTITVTDGVVTQRDYEYHNPPDPDIEFPEEEKWTETGDEIGTHERGFQPITLDEVYQIAKNDWLKKRSNTTTYFEAKNDGMISSAGYVPDGCQDDCFRGITILSITAIDDKP